MNIVKKFFNVSFTALFIAVLYFVLPINSKAANTSGKCGDNLTWTLTDDGTLTISGTGDMDDYIFDYGIMGPTTPWENLYVKKVIMNPGITKIGNNAFSYKSHLVSVSIPSTVEKLGEECFKDCDSLKSITIPSGVRFLPDLCFWGCTSLKTIIIPNSVKSFGTATFYDCSSLEYLIIPDGVSEITYRMFYRCSSLEYVQIPTSVSKIGSSAFSGCGNLQYIYYTGSKSQFDDLLNSPYFQSDKDALRKDLANVTIKYNSKAPCRDHSYSSYTNTGSGQHRSTCSNCGYVLTANHSWDGGKTTKAASCKDEGVKTYSCSACAATKTEAIPKTSTHNFGSWTKVDDSSHKHTCSTCGKQESANHSWDSGKTTKAASCKEEGVKTYSCSACAATKTEAIEKLTTHTYDHGCDIECNICLITRTPSHTAGAAATETTPQICTVCGIELSPALGKDNTTLIIAISLAVVAVTGAVVLIIVKKKK